ncbi:recombinase family protein [Glacieibacterium frigidum]|uniref:Recombinase family protein n=1 Tax=Glacieibacterium frigidum TaxID=2593303 RepID=A0A552U8J7_9SPHN|nr:recombinase family protein [Glacieibacterium frigidum]TRW14509.1 recombinase family protein [Glacieibacterium frigidum]
MKVALYARCSASKPEGETIEAQLKRSRALIHKRGWAEVSCFIDAGYSGITLDRPGMRSLIAVVESGAVEAVCVDSISRLARSQADFETLAAQCRSAGVRIIANDQG